MIRSLLWRALFLTLCAWGSIEVWAGGAAVTPIGIPLPAGTSGGIPYYNSANTIASSAALPANGIVTGGGAGTTPLGSSTCTLIAEGLTCTSTSDVGQPFMTFVNNVNDANSPAFTFQKSRAGAAVQSGDNLFNFTMSGFANGSYQGSAQLIASVAAAPSGSNVPSKWRMSTSSAGGQGNEAFIFDNNGHQSISPAAVPAITSCGGSPSTARGSDAGGEVTEGTTATGCTITFALAYTTAPFCVVSLQTQQVAFTYTISTAAITVTNTSASGDKIDWSCQGT